jgi:hypothetical protein
MSAVSGCIAALILEPVTILNYRIGRHEITGELEALGWAPSHVVSSWPKTKLSAPAGTSPRRKRE